MVSERVTRGPFANKVGMSEAGRCRVEAPGNRGPTSKRPARRSKSLHACAPSCSPFSGCPHDVCATADATSGVPRYRQTPIIWNRHSVAAVTAFLTAAPALHSRVTIGAADPGCAPEEREQPPSLRTGASPPSAVGLELGGRNPETRCLSPSLRQSRGRQA